MSKKFLQLFRKDGAKMLGKFGCQFLQHSVATCAKRAVWLVLKTFQSLLLQKTSITTCLTADAKKLHKKLRLRIKQQGITDKMRGSIDKSYLSREKNPHWIRIFTRNSAKKGLRGSIKRAHQSRYATWIINRPLRFPANIYTWMITSCRHYTDVQQSFL